MDRLHMTFWRIGKRKRVDERVAHGVLAHWEAQHDASEGTSRTLAHQEAQDEDERVANSVLAHWEA